MGHTVRIINSNSKEDISLLESVIAGAREQSPIHTFYIDYVLASKDFSIEIDARQSPTHLAEYSGRYNKIIVFVNHPSYSTHLNQLIQVMSHESMHAFLTVLHAPNHDPTSYVGDPGELLLPVYPMNDYGYKEVETYLAEAEHTIIASTYNYLVDQEQFTKEFPVLSKVLEDIAANYKPREFAMQFARTKHNCEESHRVILNGLNAGETSTITMDQGQIEITHYQGEVGDGYCYFSGHFGSREWPALLSQLYAMLKDTQTTAAFNTREYYLAYYGQRMRQDPNYWAIAEKEAHTVEMGRSLVLYDRLNARHFEDFTQHETDVAKVQQFKRATEIDPQLSEEIDSVLRYPRRVDDRKLTQYLKKHEKDQQKLAFSLYAIVMGFSQMLAPVSMLLLEGSKLLGIESSKTPSSEETRQDNTINPFVVAASVPVIAGVGYYGVRCLQNFWSKPAPKLTASPVPEESVSAERQPHHRRRRNRHGRH